MTQEEFFKLSDEEIDILVHDQIKANGDVFNYSTNMDKGGEKVLEFLVQDDSIPRYLLLEGIVKISKDLKIKWRDKSMPRIMCLSYLIQKGLVNAHD